MMDFLGQHGIRIVDAHGNPLPSDDWATLRALRQEQSVLYHEELIQRPSGDRVPVLANALPLVSAHWRAWVHASIQTLVTEVEQASPPARARGMITN
jgi:hypothetical protein